MTDEEPHGLFRRKVVEAGGFWHIAWLFFMQGFQMASQSLIRMGISQSFDLAPELLNVVTSLIPTSHDIGLVRIKTTAMLMVVVRFHILSLCEPALNGSHSQPDTLGDLFDLHPLLMERHHLLVALIPLGLVRRVRLSIRGHKGECRLFSCWRIDRLGSLRLFLQFCTAMH